MDSNSKQIKEEVAKIIKDCLVLFNMKKNGHITGILETDCIPDLLILILILI